MIIAFNLLFSIAPNGSKCFRTTSSISSVGAIRPTYSVLFCVLKEPTPPISCRNSLKMRVSKGIIDDSKKSGRRAKAYMNLSRPKQSIVVSTSSSSLGTRCHIAHLGPWAHMPLAKNRQKYAFGLPDPAVSPESRAGLHRNRARNLHTQKLNESSFCSFLAPCQQ